MPVVQSRRALAGEAAQYFYLVADDKALVVGIGSACHPYLHGLALGCRKGGTLHSVLQAADETFVALVLYLYAVGTGHTCFTVVSLGLVAYVGISQVGVVQVFEEQLAGTGCLAVGTCRGIVETYVFAVRGLYSRCSGFLQVVYFVSCNGVLPRRAVLLSCSLGGYIEHAAVLRQVCLVGAQVGGTSQTAVVAGNVCLEV